MSETVKAVGFATYAPEVVTIHYKYGRKERLHLYPEMFDEKIDLSDSTKKHVVLLRDASKRFDSPLRDHHANIHRLLVFGKPEDLEKLGIPVIDAVVKNGKIVSVPRQMPDVLSSRIQDEAVLLDLTPPLKVAKVTKDKKPKKTPSRRLMWWLNKILAEVDDDDHDSVREATFHRLVDNISKSDFRRACTKIQKDLGVRKSVVKGFYKWVEGIDGDGVFLGQAVNYYFDGAQEDGEVSIDAIAEEYKVDAGDIRLVIAALEELDDEDDE